MEKVKGIRQDPETSNCNSSFQEWNKNVEDAQNELSKLLENNYQKSIADV